MSTDAATRSKRLEKLLGEMNRAGLDAVALVPGANFYFVSDAHFHLMERPTVLFIRSNGDMHAVIPELEKTKWQSLQPDVETVYWQDSDGYEDAFAKVAGRFSAGRMGVEGQTMRFFESETLRSNFGNSLVVNAHGDISRMRLHKDEAEISLMKRAIDISQAALGETYASVTAGMTEAEVRKILCNNMMEHGAEGFAFDPIVLTGGASADPHGSPSDQRILKKGDPLLIDFGAAYGGYNADITRTVFVESVSDEHRAIYETVHAANQKGRDVARAGQSLHDLDTEVSGVLRASDFADLIVHKTGHGLGLDVHEAPQVMQGNMDLAEPGMVVTIEPGLYRAGDIGVRIEDDVLIDEDGSTSLTDFNRELMLVG